MILTRAGRETICLGEESKLERGWGRGGGGGSRGREGVCVCVCGGGFGLKNNN